MLTEDEAKGKDCFMSYPADYAGRCAGSKCMAWRWGTPISQDRDGEFFNPATTPRDKDSTPRGYCGLAGKPEKL